MFAIIGGLLGLFQSLLPEAISFLKDRQDKKHELELLNLQMKRDEGAHVYRLEEIQVNASNAQALQLQQSYRAELKYSGKYAASVRPTVTYMAMGLYLAQKALLVLAIIFAPSLPWLPKDAQLMQVATVVWTAFDETLLSWIIVFWFGDRGLNRRTK